MRVPRTAAHTHCHCGWGPSLGSSVATQISPIYLWEWGRGLNQIRVHMDGNSNNIQTLNVPLHLTRTADCRINGKRCAITKCIVFHSLPAFNWNSLNWKNPLSLGGTEGVLGLTGRLLHKPVSPAKSELAFFF